MSDLEQIVPHPGSDLCPYDENSVWRKAWLEGFTAAQDALIRAYLKDHPNA